MSALFKVKQLENQNIISIRKSMSLADFNTAFEQLTQKVKSCNLTICGAPIAIYHDSEFNPEANDTEVAFPVLENTSDTRVLDGGKYATVICKGSFDQLPLYYNKLSNWISDNGFQIVGPPFEQYLHEPTDNPSEFITEIFFMVK